VIEQPRRRRLPNGWLIEEVSRSETNYLYQEIVQEALYFSPQISMREGTVVDVGANIGLFSIFASETWAPRLIIAIEAIPDLRDVLRRNVSSLPEVIVPDVAAGASDREYDFIYYPEYSMMSGRLADPAEDFALVRQYAEQQLGDSAEPDVMVQLDDMLRPRFEPQHRRVRAVPLHTICAEAGVDTIDLLKVDVEGDELSVLEGLGDVRLRHAVVEVDARRSSVQAVRSALESRKLKVEAVTAPGYENSPLSVLFGHGN
jgi:FkbM family methyltransferase